MDLYTGLDEVLASEPLLQHLRSGTLNGGQSKNREKLRQTSVYILFGSFHSL